MADLIFDQPLPPSGNNDLQFGNPEPLVEIECEIDAVLPALVADIVVAEVIDSEVDGALTLVADVVLAEVIDCEIDAVTTPCLVSIVAEYDNNVHRGPRADLGCRWQIGIRRERDTLLRAQSTTPRPKWTDIPWQRATPRSVTVDLAHQVSEPHPMWCDMVWQQATPRSVTVDLAHRIPDPHPMWCDMVWQQATPRSVTVDLAHRVPDPHPMWCDMVWDRARQLSIVIDVPLSDARQRPGFYDLPWGSGQPVSGPGIWVPPSPPEPPAPPSRTADLIFECDLLPCNIYMDFAIRCCGEKDRPVIPILDTYIVFNEAILLRERDQRPIDCLGATARLNDGTWTWGIDVTIPVHELANIDKDERMRLIINRRYQFVWLAEIPSGARQFGQFQAVQISGRSQHAELDIERESNVLMNPISAQQLALEALENTGYTLDWRLPDWLIPAKAYSWEDRSRIERVLDVVESVKGVLWTDPAEQRLIASSRWPVAPWKWDDETPREIPSNVGYTLDWQDDPADEYNAVNVRGELVGVQALVRRYGTAGDKIAPEIIHPLITSIDAARERGIVELANTGWRRRFTLQIPLLDEIAPFELSELLQATGSENWRGLVRSITIEAAMQQDVLTAFQTLEVEQR